MKFAMSFLFLLSSIAFYSQTWRSLNDIQFDFYHVKRFEIAGDSLNIFGGFRYPGFEGDENYGVLHWDSLSFQTFGNYISGGIVYGGLQYQDEFYMAGDFSDYNDDYYQRKIARWNGLEWNSVGLGLWSPTNTIHDIEVFQDKLVVGGRFNDIEGNEDFWPDMGYWQDSTWHTMGGTWGGGGVKELIQYDDKLFVIGEFPWITPDNIIENSYAGQNAVWWDGEDWGVADEGVNGRLWDAYVDTNTNQLYVCGLCSNASGVEISNVAMWDGFEWHAVGDDLEHESLCITMYRGQLYVAFGGVRYFDGYHWHDVPGDDIQGGSVTDMIVYKDELYIGGTFDHAGGLEVDGLVRYYLHPDSVQWGVPDAVEELEVYEEKKVFVYPNPADEYIQISGDESTFINTTFSLYSASGQRVLFVEKLYKDRMLDISGLALGSYTWEIVCDGRGVGSGVLVVQ